MEVFGAHWLNHSQKISTSWKERVSDRDLVLIAGDISWAMRLHEAESDLRFIASLPGRKVLCKGNHDKLLERKQILSEDYQMDKRIARLRLGNKESKNGPR